MKPIHVSINRLAPRQYSLVHRNQFFDIGMTPRQIQARLDAGWLVPGHRGVYRLPAATSPPEQAILAACLAARGNAVASHRTAAVLWRLRGVEDAGAEITVVGDRHVRLSSVVSIARTRWTWLTSPGGCAFR